MKKLSLVALVALLGACSSSIDPVEPPSELTAFTPELTIHSRWSHGVGAGTGGQHLKLSPLLNDDKIYVADRYGDVRSYHSLSGEKLWQVELKRPVGAGPGIVGDLLLFGGDAEIFALDKASGELRWRTALGSEVLSTPVSSGDTLVIHAVDGTVLALDSRDGKVLWRHLERVPRLSLHGTGEPLIVDDSIVVFGSAGGQLVALSLRNGNLLWRTEVTTVRGRTDLDRLSDVDGQLAAANGVIYAAAFQGRVVAIQASNGKLVWSREISSQTGVVYSNDALFLSDEVGDVWALSARNGATMWKQDVLHRRALGAPAQQGRYLIFGDLDGYMHWINKENGRLAARTRIRHALEHFPIEDEFDDDSYQEDRALIVSPLVEGTRVYGFDKRGVLDAYEVSIKKGDE